MSLVKVANGKLFEDDFTSGYDASWDILPFSYDRVSINQDSITIQPGDYIEMLLKTPSGEFEMYAEISYISLEDGDEAGIVIKSTTGRVVECNFSYNKCEQREIRFVKIKKTRDNNFYARYSYDGEKWFDLGCTYFDDSHTIGFYNDSYLSPLEIKHVVICQNQFVIINGISKDDTITLYDSSLNDLTVMSLIDINRTNDRAILDLTNCTIPLKECEIIINEISDNPISLYVESLYGSDVFDFKPDMHFVIEDMYGQVVKNLDLGEINHTEKMYTVTLYNTSDSVKHGSIVLEPVSTYDSGVDMVFLHTLGSDFSYPSKSISCTILPESHFKCILQVKKDPGLITIDDRFNFRLTFV